jgi:hypothetical protein
VSLVPYDVWDLWMGNMPMPENCTFEEMRAMYDVVKQIEDREYAAKQISWYENLWRLNLPKYKLAEEGSDEYEVYKSIMLLIKEGIIHWREMLV